MFTVKLHPLDIIADGREINPTEIGGMIISKNNQGS